MIFRRVVSSLSKISLSTNTIVNKRWFTQKQVYLKADDWIEKIESLLSLEKVKFRNTFQDLENKAKDGDVNSKLTLAALFSTSPDKIKEAFEWYENAAQKDNHPFAQYALAIIYFTGSTLKIFDNSESEKGNEIYYIDLDNLDEFLGDAKSPPKEDKSKFNFTKWLKKERLAQRKKIQKSESDCESESEDSKISFESGLYWLEKSASNGCIEAQLSLGMYYLEKNFDFSKAELWLKEAAEQGSSFAMYRLGQLHYDDRDIEETFSEDNKPLWFSWFEKAAINGDASACYWLGYAYDQGIVGLEPNPEDSISWLKRAIELGNKQAMYYLAMIFRDPNKNVPLLDMEERLSTSLKLLEEASELPDGDPEAQFILGQIYFEGEGVDQNYEKALKNFKESGKKGHADALCYVGVMYYNGWGTNQDYEKAFYAYQNASLYDSKLAHKNLHDMYTKGIGVEKSEVSAQYHLQKAMGNQVEHEQFLKSLLSEISIKSE